MFDKVILPQLNAADEEDVVVVTSRKRWFDLRLGDVWHHRELLSYLIWRDITLRYKQTVLGIFWAILQPLLPMIVFTVVFGVIANLPSEGIPYPVFIMAALLPWLLFSYALTSVTNSLISNQALITKVYFPRLIILLSSLAVGSVDFLVGSVFFLIMTLFYGILPTIRLVLIPVLVLFLLLTVLSIGLWTSALAVRFRDVSNLVPFLTQFWMYATPVIYSIQLIPKRWVWLYNLNPMTGIIEGFRWVLVGTMPIFNLSTWISMSFVVALLFGGLLFFNRTQDEFADVI